jgi:hypothetical protein
MKNNFFLSLVCLACFSVGVIHGCTKDVSTPVPTNTPPDPVIPTSFIEEFKDIPTLTTTTDWVTKNNSGDSLDYDLTDWGQGLWGIDKSGQEYGMTAYSYTTYKTEYVFSGASYAPISSWLITPVLSVKNGDKISFYTQAYTPIVYAERLQVLMNKSTSTDVGGTMSAGSFTTTLFDINSNQVQGGYPEKWTKYEYTFSGISSKMNTRIAFRHYLIGTINARGIGLDQFKFEAN